MLDSTRYASASCSLELTGHVQRPQSGLAKVRCRSSLPLLYLSDMATHIRKAVAGRNSGGAAGDQPQGTILASALSASSRPMFACLKLPYVT